ncbi:cysteine and histidine-rich domain-containing protein RAR1 [Magnolia sinica]|uniref:cysteine and histidine-rich domain-containing protein RAR1 n=1 Tax=Magnolia sinica TaxID=86752 RepID=UPI002659AF30|nr:cysteine and histidine-rich domain-containing protein RAR1 [Magnolia sinica]
MEKDSAKFRCQRIGCDAMFTEDDNPEDSCRYHDSPIFHDGMKEWSCCKQRSHDFSLFLALPGCKTGKHTTEKPVTKAVSSQKKTMPGPIAANNQTDASKLDCSRCRQGFFCSDHGSHARVVNSKPLQPVVTPSESEACVQKIPPAPAKIIDLNAPQTCRNKGCGKTFKEKDNHDSACEYHPGPAIFHDRMRGWKCCDVHVKEFDEFMSIPPCTKGWHNADPVS